MVFLSSSQDGVTARSMGSLLIYTYDVEHNTFTFSLKMTLLMSILT